jgi:hypothetical protein
VFNFESGRGVRVLQDTGVGGTLLSVPWDLLITVEHLVNASHPIGRLVSRHKRKIPQTDYLALFLLYESSRPRRWLVRPRTLLCGTLTNPHHPAAPRLVVPMFRHRHAGYRVPAPGGPDRMPPPPPPPRPCLPVLRRQCTVITSQHCVISAAYACSGAASAAR